MTQTLCGNFFENTGVHKLGQEYWARDLKSAIFCLLHVEMSVSRIESSDSGSCSSTSILDKLRSLTVSDLSKKKKDSDQSTAADWKETIHNNRQKVYIYIYFYF